MTWQLALQTFTTGLAGIAVYFIWDLVREYKSFKTQASSDLTSIKTERRQFEIAVQAAGLKFEEMRHRTESAITTINHEIKIFRYAMEKIGKDTDTAGAFMRKSYELSVSLNNKMREHEKEIKTIKIQIGEMTIFKTKKD